jgi:Rad3-related DNA helicase
VKQDDLLEAYQDQLAKRMAAREAVDVRKFFQHNAPTHWRKTLLLGSEEVLRKLFAGQIVVCHVAPTGVGKSLGFLLPAAASPTQYSQTIVITPLVAMQNNILDKCK